MKCIILGQGKSGTSALHSAVLGELKGARSVWEPRRIDPRDLDGKDVVIKKLIEFLDEEEVELLDRFDTHLWIVRDPRDTVISRLLYAVWNREFTYDDDRLGVFLRALEEKERDPTSVSCVQLYELIRELDGKDLLRQLRGLNRRTIELWKRLGPRFHRVQYESFVAGERASLEEHLGFPLRDEVAVPAQFQRVVRRKSFGDWKHWFTPEDVDYFRELLGELMVSFGYEDSWTLEESPRIEAEYCSLYVKRLAGERRKGLAIRRLRRRLGGARRSVQRWLGLSPPEPPDR